MEILEILQNSKDELLLEDLDFFETELATGEGYSEPYQNTCRSLINQLRSWMKNPVGSLDDAADTTDQVKTEDTIQLTMEDITPKGVGPELSPEQVISKELSKVRLLTDYKSRFKKLVKESELITVEFVDKNYKMFSSWELSAIVEVVQMGEVFLEKYFDAVDHDKIARYQLFSEAFFMKHYGQLDESIVLLQGKNDWRKKGNRSKQLDVFLRLKGVKF